MSLTLFFVMNVPIFDIKLWHAYKNIVPYLVASPLFFDTCKALEFRDYFLDLEKYVMRVKQDVNII